MERLASTFRVRLLRERWRRLAAETGGAPVALYGAGAHTRFLLDLVGDLDGPSVGAILDDAPRCDAISGAPVLTPEQAKPEAFAAVVVSSDAHEEALASRASAWAGSVVETKRPAVVRLYEGLPPGPYPGLPSWRDAEPDVVLRIPAPPERTGATPTSADEPPVPPDDRRAGYVTGSDTAYLQQGKEVNNTIRNLVCASGLALDSVGSVLEWGSSSGRVLRHWLDLTPRTSVWGCDLDTPAIEWAQTHLSPPLRFVNTTLAPHLPFPDRAFDLIYAISVMTHLPTHCDAWLAELRRIAAPDARVVLTIHDERTWAACAADPAIYAAKLCPDLDFSEPLTDDFVCSGRGSGAQTFWRTDAVRRRWSPFFDVLHIEPMAVHVQSAVVMRPRG